MAAVPPPDVPGPDVPGPRALRRYGELDGKTLLVCVGAAKTGTSWLHQHLAAQPGVVVSPLKELHFFNARFAEGGAPDWDRLAVRRLLHHIGQDGDPAENLRARPAFQASLDRLAMIHDDDAYFGHFARLCGPEGRVICDITPAYATLGEAGFAAMRGFAASQDLRLKVLFMMREPVARLWSQLRHMQQMDPRIDAARDWAGLIARPEVFARADYAATVRALDAALPAQDLLFLFHERLTEPETLAALNAFLGLGAPAPSSPERRNETAVKAALPEAARAAFARRLADQRAFCRARFGAAATAPWCGPGATAGS